jgi:integrase
MPEINISKGDSVMSKENPSGGYHSAMTTNPTRDVAPVGVQKKIIRALTVEISATATAFGIEERPKTKAGWRVIAIPPNVVKILRRRIRASRLRTEVVLFPSPIGRIRDPSNTSADLRRALSDASFGWVTSHTFRKTVATRLDEAGLSARSIADHLGHAAPSMTQDVYMGRRAANSEAATVLDR